MSDEDYEKILESDILSLLRDLVTALRSSGGRKLFVADVATLGAAKSVGHS